MTFNRIPKEFRMTLNKVGLVTMTNTTYEKPKSNIILVEEYWSQFQ